jgi:ankyrin repeat protein
MIRLCALLLCVFSAMASAASQANSDPENAEVAQQLRDYLFDAARAGDAVILTEFIEAGYDLNTQDGKGYTALILAAYNGRNAAVAQLLAAGANPCTEDQRGNTALMGAIFKGEVRIARRLLKADCSPDQRNQAGQTPAMYAALFQRTEILAELKASGAELDAEDAMGNRVDNLLQGEFKTPPRTE